MILPVLVLAGGRGRRMSPLTDTLPKCLLPVAGKPFAQHQIDWLHKQGLINITFSIGYRGDQVREALGPEISYREAADCGIQKAAYQAMMQGPFYLLYGDVLPYYSARHLYAAYRGGFRYSVMGECDEYFDTGFSLMIPNMRGIDFIHTRPSLEIGSPEGYLATRRHFGEDV